MPKRPSSTSLIMSLPAANSRICIIRLSSFGDVLLTTPLIENLRRAVPQAHLTMISRAPFICMIEHHPELDQVITWSEDLSLDTEFDLVIDLQNNIRSKRLLKRMKYREKASYQKQQISRFFYVNMKLGTFNTPIRSVVERYHQSLGKYDIPMTITRPSYHIKGTYERLTSDPYMVIAPGAAHFTKQWPETHFGELIAHLQHQYPNHRIVLLGGPAEKATSAHLQAKFPRLINKTGETDFDESAAIIRDSELVICNDSSIMHLANALDRPIVVFFGSTTERFGFFPYGARFVALEQSELNCRPCSHIGRSACPEGHFRCMFDTSPVQAIEAVNRVMGVSK